MVAKPLLQASFVVGERLVFLVPQFATIVLVSRFWGQERFGEYALVLTWARMFQGMINFGTTECLARDIGREPERGSSFFTHGLALVVLFALIGMGIMVSAAWAMRYPAHVTQALLLASGSLVPAGALGACRGVLLARGRAEYMMGVGAVESAILLSLNVYWILAGTSLVPLIGIMVGATTVSALLATSLVHRRVTPVSGPLRPALLRRHWNTILPFGISSLIAFPAMRFDIIILSKMATFGQLGLYTAASKVFEFLFVLPLAFYMAMLPRAAQHIAGRPEERREGVLRPLVWYFSILVPLSVGLAALANPVMLLLYGAEFVAGAPLLRILMGVFLLVTVDVALNMICKAAGYQRRDLAFVAASTTLKITGCFVLIPQLGAAGAALAVAASVLLGLILRWRLVTRTIWVEDA